MSLAKTLLENPDLEVEDLIEDPQLSLRDIVSDIFESTDPNLTIRQIMEQDFLGGNNV